MKRPEERAKLDGEKIEFSNVSFSYNDTEVLYNISFETDENEITALVGPSGSGKSTVAWLIASFWNAGSRTIKIGGIDVKKYHFHKSWNILPMFRRTITFFIFQYGKIYKSVSRMLRTKKSKMQQKKWHAMILLYHFQMAMIP